MFLFCKWQGKRVDCDKVVKQRKTDDGFCCSFNTIDLTEGYALSEEDLEEEDGFGGCSTGMDTNQETKALLKSFLIQLFYWGSFNYSSSTESYDSAASNNSNSNSNSSDYQYDPYDFSYGCFYSAPSADDSDTIIRWDKQAYFFIIHIHFS